MSRELPASAIPVSERMPVPHRSVLGYVTDASVAIHNHPAIIHNSGTNADPIWWSGLPGHWIPLGRERWTVTHWEPLPIDQGKAA